MDKTLYGLLRQGFTEWLFFVDGEYYPVEFFDPSDKSRWFIKE